MKGEAGGVWAEDLAPDPGEVGEPTHHPLQEGGRRAHARRRNFSIVVKCGSLLGEPEHPDQLLRGRQVVLDVLPVGLPDHLHQDKKGDVLPDCEVLPGVLA